MRAVMDVDDIELDDQEMLMVLIYEALVHGQRLRMGGRIVQIVKHYSEALKAVLSGKGVVGKVAGMGQAKRPGAVYIRPNFHRG